MGAERELVVLLQARVEEDEAMLTEMDSSAGGGDGRDARLRPGDQTQQPEQPPSVRREEGCR